MTTNHMTPRLFLAREIQREREAKGMTRDALAKAVYVSESLVKAWEKGRRVPQPEQLSKAEDVLGTNGYLTRMRDDLVKNEVAPEWMGKWLVIEEQATQLLSYQPLLVPGLLQTPEYARAIIAGSGRQVDDLEAQVQRRIERQKVLVPEDSVTFVAVIDEGVLYRPIGGAATLHEQLAKVLQMAEQPNVNIQVVPQDVGAYPGLSGGFVIASMAGKEFSYVDDSFSGDVLEHPEDIAIMKRTWEMLRLEALPGKQSVELIARTVERWTT